MLVVLLYFSFLGQCNTHTKWKSASVTHLTTTNSILSLLQPIYVHVSIRLNADIILIGWSKTKYIWTNKTLVRPNISYWILLFDLCPKGFGRVQKRYDKAKDCRIILYWFGPPLSTFILSSICCWCNIVTKMERLEEKKSE